MELSFLTRKFQRSMAGFSLLAILASFAGFGTASAMSFSDVDDDYYAVEQIDALSDAGVMTGYEDGTFGPDDVLTREQAAKILVLAFVGAADEDAEVTCDGTVSDWATSYVATANLYGIMEGDDEGNCNAADDVNRAEFAKMVVNAAGLASDGTMASDMFDDVESGSWYDEVMGTAYVYSVMSGYENGDMGPADSVTRGQAAKMTYNAMYPEYIGGDDDDDDDTTSDATVMVEVSDESPDSMTVPSYSTSVEVASFDFTAEGDDAVLESLKVHQYGVFTLPSDHEVYLYNGTERLTSGVSVNSTTSEATFNNVDVDLEDGETVTLTVRLNVGNVTSSGEVGFEIESADAVETNSDVEGDFAVQADKHSLSTTSVSTVTIEKNGTITNPTVGEKEVTIAKFQLSAGTNSAAIQELGLYISGTVGSNEIGNFQLFRQGESEALATVESVDDLDVVRFVFEDEYDSDASACSSYEGYCIENGSSRTFEVKADFNTGRTNDTVKVYLDENVDMFAVDTKYGFGAKVTSTNYDGNADSCASGSSADCSYSTLQGGDITMTRHTIENTNLAVNQNDAMIMNFTVTTQTDVTFNNFVLKLSAEESVNASGLLNDDGATSTGSNFTDIRVKAVDGSFTWGPVDADQLKTAAGGSTAIGVGTDTVGYYTFTDDLAMDEGDSIEFGVYVDVENNSSLNNDGITASVYIDASYPEIKDSNNNIVTNSSSLVPTSTFSAEEFTVQANSLEVVLSNEVPDATKVIGTEDAALAAFSLSAGSANDLEVTQFNVKGYYDTDTSGVFTAGGTFRSIVPDLDLYVESMDEDGWLDSDGADATTGAIEFNDFTYTIPAGTTVEFFVTGNIENNTSYNNYRVKVDIADVSADIVASDESGSSVTSASADAPNGGTADSGTRVTVSSGGTLTVDVFASTASSQIVVAGTTDNEFSTLKFTATRENFKVYKLALKNDYSATVGDYDDNLESVNVSYYTDAEQTEEATTECSRNSAGVFACNLPSDAPMIVPDSDLSGVPDQAYLTVWADLASTASDAADEGDRPNLTFSLADDFEAKGADSNKLVEESGSYDVSIVDVATSSFSNAATGYVGADTDGAVATASATSIVLDNGGGADAGDAVLVGALLCVDNVTDNQACDATEEQMYVTAVTDGATEDTLTVVRGVNGTTGATIADNVDVLVVLPASVLATNFMQVQATDLDMTVASSTRTGTQSASESIMTISATADDAKVVKLRTGMGEGDYSENTVTAAGAASAAAVSSNPTPIAGTYATKLFEGDPLDSNDAATLNMGATGLLDDYAYASVWVYIHDDATTGNTLNSTQLLLGTSTANNAVDQTQALGSSTTTLAEEVWLFFSGVAVPTGTDASDQYASLRLGAAMGDAADYVAFDDLRFYNESLNVDLTMNEQWAASATTPTVAYLTQNGTIVATGYVDVDGAISTKSGQIFFVPVGTYGDIEISGTDTLAVLANTTNLFTEDSTATELLTARVDLGNVSNAGDVRWYDGEDILTFLGVNSTDKVEVVSSY